jgi:23S rRNA-/tRNA-specific pseudouridylate synthase
VSIPRPDWTFPDGTTLAERVLVDEAGLLIINKPWRIPTAGRNLDDPDCVQWHVIQACRKMVWAVHQLDADTSGVLVLVRRRTLVPVWQRALGDDATSKVYLAWLQGTLAGDHHRVDEPVGALDAGGRQLGVTSDGKSALSEFSVLARSTSATLVKVRIHTGRTHQIRIHAQHLGHSLVGEEWYADRPCQLHERQALHAWRIELADPSSVGVDGALEAPVPADLLQLHARLGFTQSLESLLQSAAASE